MQHFVMLTNLFPPPPEGGYHIQQKPYMSAHFFGNFYKTYMFRYTEHSLKFEES